jgi:hypothetical protein
MLSLILLGFALPVLLFIIAMGLWLALFMPRSADRRGGAKARSTHP